MENEEGSARSGGPADKDGCICTWLSGHSHPNWGCSGWNQWLPCRLVHASLSCFWFHHKYPFPGYLRGVDVIGETSLPVTNQAQTFTWASHGMKLHIPPNSLPAKLKQCKLHIKVGLSGQFALPENTSLVSAVYWLDSEPRCKLSKSINVEIQHCAKPTQITGLSFVRAKCSQKDLPYTFKTLAGGVFSQQTNFGCISLNEFSILSVLKKMFVVDSYYCASFYYTGSKFCGDHKPGCMHHCK